MSTPLSELHASDMNGDQRYREIRRVTVFGMLGNACLVVLKLTFGFLGHSQALIADGLHSLSDLSNDFLLVFAAKHAAKDADEEHPYGHARIETLFTVGQGLLLGAFAVGIGYDALTRLLGTGPLLEPAWFTLVVAAVSVMVKESLYRYTVRAAKRLRSNMLRGNAWDHRSDAISSIVVVVGVAGTFMGLPYLDAVAAIGVALMIIKVSWDMLWHSLRELIDTGLDQERVDAIRATIMRVSGVKACHMLRTRRMGADALVDVHILVDPTLSVSEGHQISETVRGRLIKEIEEVSDVMVHIDPEDDEQYAPCRHLPLREEMLSRLQHAWRDLPAARAIDDVTLHYLDGKVQVEVLLPLSVASDIAQAQAITRQFERAVVGLGEVGSIQVRYH